MRSPRVVALVAWSALALALGAFVFSGVSGVVAKRHLPGPSLKPRKFGILRLNKKRSSRPGSCPAGSSITARRRR